MKKYVILGIILVGFFTPTFADSGQILNVKIVNSTNSTQIQNLSWDEATREDIFNTLWWMLTSQVRASFSSIAVQYSDVKKGSILSQNLQKLIYLDILPNKSSKVFPTKTMNAYIFYSLAEKVVGTEFMWENKLNANDLKKRNTLSSDIKYVSETYKNIIDEKASKDAIPKDSSEVEQVKEIFTDVYDTLKTSHYNHENLDEKQMMYSAIQWLTKGTGDKFTNYFPPVENQNFQDSLSGNYEGIGAYVDIVTPWQLTIVSPIIDGPAYKAGLKAGDIVTAIDDKIITENNSLTEVVWWIKWPAGTEVKLTVQRGWGSPFVLPIKRARITIKEVDTKTFNGDTFYIQIKSFWDNTYDGFTKALTTLKNTRGVSKIIFDLRNNPGGYLDVVNEMLGHFVPEWDTVSVIKYHDFSIQNRSSGYNDIDFSKYKIVILENGGTASAAEIMIWTLKDYFPKAEIIGEKSYGKGSVQTLKDYSDGSTLKYTIAKWYTGKTETGIDGVGIKPDMEVKLSDEDIKSSTDSQLNAALKY